MDEQRVDVKIEGTARVAGRRLQPVDRVAAERSVLEVLQADRGAETPVNLPMH